MLPPREPSLVGYVVERCAMRARYETAGLLGNDGPSADVPWPKQRSVNTKLGIRASDLPTPDLPIVAMLMYDVSGVRIVPHQ